MCANSMGAGTPRSHALVPSLPRTGPARHSCPGTSRLPKASAGRGAVIQEVAMATAGLRAISCNQPRTRPPAGLPGDLFSTMGRWACGGTALLISNPLSSSVFPSAAPGMGGLPGWDSVFGRGFPWTGSRDRSSGLKYAAGTVCGLE